MKGFPSADTESEEKPVPAAPHKRQSPPHGRPPRDGSSWAPPSSPLPAPASRHTPSAHGESRKTERPEAPTGTKPRAARAPRALSSASPQCAPTGRPDAASGRRNTPRCPPAPGPHPGQPQPSGAAQSGLKAGTDRQHRRSRARRSLRGGLAAGVRICPFGRWRPPAGSAREHFSLNKNGG